jgi:hypothetical protein
VRDNLVFVLPEYMEECLFATTVMMHYLVTRLVVGKIPDSVTVVCKEPAFTTIIKANWPWATVMYEPSDNQLDNADMVFEFDTERAYALTKNVQKHVAEAYGIQLGVGLFRILPPILVEDIPEVRGHLLVADRNIKDRPLPGSDWKHLNAFVKIGEEQGVPITTLGPGACFEEMRQAVGRSAAVVGVRGTATLLAGAAGKIVYELSPDSQHPQWMTKYEDPLYRMAYGKLDDMVPDFVWVKLIELIGSLKAPEKNVALAHPSVEVSSVL